MPTKWRRNIQKSQTAHPLNSVIGLMTNASKEFREMHRTRAHGGFIDIDIMTKKIMNKYGAPVARIFGVPEYQGQELARRVLLMKAKSVPNEVIIKRISNMVRDRAEGKLIIEEE
jgi:hypothetical protein